MNNINSPLYTTFWIIVYFLVALFFIALAIYIFASIKKKKNEKVTQYKMTFLQIKLPEDNEIEIEVAEHMFSNLAAFKKPFLKTLFSTQYRISFEIVSKKEGIGFYVSVPDQIAALVEKQINAAYPSAEIDIVNPHEVWDRGKVTRVAELKLKAPPYYPIKRYEDLKNDSLSSITSAMSKMDESEVLAVQYIIQPASNGWRLAGRQFISRIKTKAANPEKKVNIDTSFLEAVENKVGFQGFYTKIRIISIAENKMEAENQVQNMMSAFEQFTDMNYNRFVKRKYIPYKKLIDDFIYRKSKVKDIRFPIIGFPIYSNTSILNIEELATIFHFPNKDVGTPNIIWLSARRSQTPTNIPTEGLYLGKSSFRGVDKKIYMEEKERARHFYIIGQTGTGKSQFMMSLALQDIENGEGVCLIDPHGTDVRELLEKIPPERKDDVIYFNVSDIERPLGLNLLEAGSEEEQHLLINAFIAMLYKLYDPNHQGIMGPLLERSIRNVMLTAMTDPEATMVDVMRLLIDDKYHEQFLPNVKDPMVVRYWKDEVANTSKNRKGEVMGYIVSKFDRLITDKTMRLIMGQPKSSLNLRKIMAEKKILLVDLAKGKIGEENSNFIGLLLVPRILTTALARHKMIEEGQDFPPFYLYVDEFQNFATDDFETILSEARKYKLCLTVAHQFIAQLPDNIKQAIFGNVGSLATFRVGVDDAEFLESQYEPIFTQKDIINLPIGNAYTRLLVKGQPTPPFSMYADWEMISAQKKNPQIAKEIIEASRQTYGTPAAEIEEYIEKRMGYKEEPEEDLPPLPDLSKAKLPF